jgi:hypothetical protein
LSAYTVVFCGHLSDGYVLGGGFEVDILKTKFFKPESQMNWVYDIATIMLFLQSLQYSETRIDPHEGE